MEPSADPPDRWRNCRRRGRPQPTGGRTPTRPVRPISRSYDSAYGTQWSLSVRQCHPLAGRLRGRANQWQDQGTSRIRRSRKRVGPREWPVPRPSSSRRRRRAIRGASPDVLAGLAYEVSGAGPLGPPERDQVRGRFSCCHAVSSLLPDAVGDMTSRSHSVRQCHPVTDQWSPPSATTRYTSRGQPWSPTESAVVPRTTAMTTAIAPMTSAVPARSSSG